MIDKNNDINTDKNQNIQDDTLNFDDDLESALDLTSDLNLPEDDFLLTDDLKLNSAQNKPTVDNNNITNKATAMPQASSLLDFIKSYGPFLLVGGLFIYFGLKYSVGVMVDSGAKSQSAEPITQAVSGNESSADTDIVATGSQVSLDEIPGLSVSPSVTQNNVNADNVNIDNMNTVETQVESGAGTVAQPAVANIQNNLDNNLATSSLSAELNQKISDLSLSVDNLNKKINAQPSLDKQALDNLQQQFNAVSTQLEQVALYVQGISKAMGVLSEQVRKQQAILSTFIDSNIGIPASKKKGEMGITLEAIVSGRAWLRTVQGGELTVTPGDKIPGYGKVIEINSKAGTVTTDIGTVFTQ